MPPALPATTNAPRTQQPGTTASNHTTDAKRPRNPPAGHARTRAKMKAQLAQLSATSLPLATSRARRGTRDAGRGRRDAGGGHYVGSEWRQIPSVGFRADDGATPIGQRTSSAARFCAGSRRAPKLGERGRSPGRLRSVAAGVSGWAMSRLRTQQELPTPRSASYWTDRSSHPTPARPLKLMTPMGLSIGRRLPMRDPRY